MQKHLKVLPSISNNVYLVQGVLLTTLIKFIVMLQNTEEVIRGYNVLQAFGTAVTCPAAREENEFQNQLKHQLNDTSRPISGLIFKSILKSPLSLKVRLIQ
uniref:Uncharacterized protein n=1 Tax=Glossina palpalis gambiensis TaxID=67801 RepID=A0A1B0BIF6_9MUSC